MRVLIVPNVINPSAVAATVELATFVSGLGLDPVLANGDAEKVGLAAHGVAPADIGQPVLTVALGGDGTILKAVHLLGEQVSPVLGVKFGRLGFLSGARGESMRAAVEAALAGEAVVEPRAMLRAEVIMEGRTVGVRRALNEVVLSRGVSGKVIAIDVAIDGHRVAHMRADGVVVATATGSTAYALSAGGPVVAPGFGGLIVVPVAPHTLQSRAVVTDPSHVVELTLPDPGRSDATIVVDGEPIPNRLAIDKVIVSRDEHDVQLVKLEGRDFYETVASEFFGG